MFFWNLRLPSDFRLMRRPVTKGPKHQLFRPSPLLIRARAHTHTHTHTNTYTHAYGASAVCTVSITHTHAHTHTHTQTHAQTQTHTNTYNLPFSPWPRFFALLLNTIKIPQQPGLCRKAQELGKGNSGSSRQSIKYNKTLLNIIKWPQQPGQCRTAELGKWNSGSSRQPWKTAPLFLLAHPWQCPRTAPVHTHTHTHTYMICRCVYISYIGVRHVST